MVFKIDYLDEAVLTWTPTENGVVYEKHQDYRPTLYIAGDIDDLMELRAGLAGRPDVAATCFEDWRTRWRKESETVLRVDVEEIDAVNRVAYSVRRDNSPHQFELFNVDINREHRFCLENQEIPVPARDLSVVRIEVSKEQLDREHISRLRIDGNQYTGSRSGILQEVAGVLDREDPDILAVNTAAIVPRLNQQAADTDTAFRLGRLSDYQQLAGNSTYESYGRVGHSPARYNVPGRAIIDESNCFWWGEGDLPGMLDMVERSWKPIQELSWASIGSVLAAIEMRHAMQNRVLIPRHSWRHEFFKSMRILHESDRGGFIFSPDVGVHEEVYEIDFSSLYPNIMITRNVSPETVCCDCHDSEDVPGLGYSICEERGFLMDVLEPMIRERERMKQEIKTVEDEDRRKELKGRIDAIRWVGCACFGYQGFSNTKFGRIECHETISAFAREILLDTKELFEENGWRIVHGIIDSLWVQPVTDDPTPIMEMCHLVTEEIGITLDFEQAYDWIAFCPRRDTGAGALTRYFGSVKNRDEFKVRGIEARQRSTPRFIAKKQRELLEVLDRNRDPEAVCDRLQLQIKELEDGTVDPAELLIRTRVSKSLDEYRHHTRTVAALERSERLGREVYPGQDVRYVVVDDRKRSIDRVQLGWEDLEDYDPAFYREELIRAAESVLSPLNWNRDDIKQYLSNIETTNLRSFAVM